MFRQCIKICSDDMLLNDNEEHAEVNKIKKSTDKKDFCDVNKKLR